MVYVQEHRRLTGSGSDFKASQKMEPQIKVSSNRLGEARNQTCDPWFTRHMFIPYTTAADQTKVSVQLIRADPDEVKR